MKDKKKTEKKGHILACLSSAPSNAKIIRTAARMAKAFNSQFTALFVETPDFSAATPENKKRLLENRKLAEQLGAGIETVYGDDVPFQIAEFARLSGVTEIVLGRSAITRRHLLGQPTLTEQLLSYVPEIDIHIIPDREANVPYRPRKARRIALNSILQNTAKSALILLAATLLGILFQQLGFTDPNIIMVYILGVLLTSIATSHRIYSLVSAVASVFIFNFFFTIPRFSMAAYGTGYPVTFVVMFVTAYITGTFSIKYKEQAKQSAKIARRTKILFDTGQILSKAKGKTEIFDSAAKQIVKLLGRNIAIFENLNGKLSEPVMMQAKEGSTEEREISLDLQKEIHVADWVLQHNHNAGATTERFSETRFLYLAIRVNERVYGVIGIDVENQPLDASEHSILLSILGECALALENEKNAREKEEAAVLAESEQLRANLLRTISHDLRTPLTTISGNASNLISNSSYFDEETKQQLYRDIYADSMWLNNLVENLLYATRIEEGRMKLQLSTELIGEIVEEALQHVKGRSSTHIIHNALQEEIILVKADAKLVVQVLVNIIENAIKYTPAGSKIMIKAEKEGNMARIEVTDSGSGIIDAEKERIFDKFYCGKNKIADSRRSIGLGLYLCKAIIEAHGGTIEVKDNKPQGAIFSFTLPMEEMKQYE
ncbi:MAG: sensor histidine kinase KdpD [Firmicutes bacterium]|nr:sensor histidine kinase KdpD [Bacillota bacterium]